MTRGWTRPRPAAREYRFASGRAGRPSTALRETDIRDGPLAGAGNENTAAIRADRHIPGFVLTCGRPVIAAQTQPGALSAARGPDGAPSGSAGLEATAGARSSAHWRGRLSATCRGSGRRPGYA